MFFSNNNQEPMIAICPMPELTRQLFELEDLLKEKYLNIDANVTFGKGQVNVRFLNGRNGMHHGIDEENILPIAFLKSFGAKETRKEAEHPYWSYSVLKLEESKLQHAIAKLQLLPTVTHDGSRLKMMARG